LRHALSGGFLRRRRDVLRERCAREAAAQSKSGANGQESMRAVVLHACFPTMLKLEITVNFDLKLLIWQDFFELLLFQMTSMPRNIAKIHHLLLYPAARRRLPTALRLCS
jgi:hypothetical protein